VSARSTAATSRPKPESRSRAYGRADAPTIDEEAFQAAFPSADGAWTIGRQVQSPQ